LVEREPTDLSVGQVLDFHDEILSRMGEQQVIGRHLTAKPTLDFTLNAGVLALIS
jgi:hypothetical protein